MVIHRSTNKAKCLVCNTVIESRHVHDFVTCPCGNLSVDGGNDYLRRACKDFEKMEELSNNVSLDVLPFPIQQMLLDRFSPEQIFIHFCKINEGVSVIIEGEFEQKLQRFVFEYDAEVKGDQYVGKWNNPLKNV